MEIFFKGDTLECQGWRNIVCLNTGIRKLLMEMPVSSGVWDSNGKQLAKNQYSVGGYAPSDLVGKNIRLFIPEYQHYILEPLFSAVIDYSRKITDMHIDMFQKDKSIITVMLSCMPVQWDGNPYILCFANRSHKLSTVESFAEGSLQSLYDIQRQLKAINDSVGVLRTLLINGPERL